MLGNFEYVKLHDKGEFMAMMKLRLQISWTWDKGFSMEYVNGSNVIWRVLIWERQMQKIKKKRGHNNSMKWTQPRGVGLNDGKGGNEPEKAGSL